MNLEHRVKVLEQEVQILKNQIRETLLDIQEQMLNDHYPNLRADAVGSHSAPASSPRPPVPSPAAPPAPVRTVSSAEIEDEPADDPVRDLPQEPARPIVRQVILANSIPEDDDDPTRVFSMREVEPEPADNPSDEFSAMLPEAAEYFPENSIDADWETFNQYTRWAMENLQTLGADRARMLVEVYATGGFFTERVKTALLMLVERFEQQRPVDEWIEETVEVLGGPADNTYDPDLDQALPDQNERIGQRDTVLRMIRGLRDLDARWSDTHG